MEIGCKTGDILKTRVDALVVNLFQGVKKPTGATGAVDQALGGAITQLISDGEIKGSRGEFTVIHTLGKIAPARVVVLGLGRARGLNAEVVRAGMGEASRSLRKVGVRRIATVLHGAGVGGMSAQDAARAITEGVILGLYTFDKYKKRNPSQRDLAAVTIVEKDRSKTPEILRGVDVGRIVSESACLARDMVNEPANHMGPSDIGDIAKNLVSDGALDVTVLEKEEIERLGMGALLGVARGSAQPPPVRHHELSGRPGPS